MPASYGTTAVCSPENHHEYLNRGTDQKMINRNHPGNPLPSSVVVCSNATIKLLLILPYVIPAGAYSAQQNRNNSAVMDVRKLSVCASRRRNSSNTFPVAFFSVYPHAIVVIAETTKKNKNNKIRGVTRQNSFLIFIGVYRQHYYEENRIIKIRNYL